MENYIVCPTWGLNIAFFAACALLLLMKFLPEIILSKTNISKVKVYWGNLFFFLLGGVAITSLIGGFSLPIYLFCQHGAFFSLGMYVLFGFVVGAMACTMISECFSKDISYIRYIFYFALGQAIVALVALACLDTSYMFYALCLIVIDILGIVAEYILDNYEF